MLNDFVNTTTIPKNSVNYSTIQPDDQNTSINETDRVASF